MNLPIDESILNKAIAIKIAFFPQFYECAEYQMIRLFEQLYGENVSQIELKKRDDEKFLLEAITEMLTTLALTVNFDLKDNIKEALARHLMLHSMIPKDGDNLVMRDYYNPVLMNHFTFYMYLSEYLHGYKNLICVDDKTILRKQVHYLATMTNQLVFHSINKASLDNIVDKVVEDWGDVVAVQYKPQTAQMVYKFEHADCKHDFTMRYYCDKSDYVELAMSLASQAHGWIQEQIVADKVPVSETNQMMVRYYMYRYLEKSFFELSPEIRASVPSHIRSAAHSTISDLVVIQGNRVKTILPNTSFGKIKARDIPLWIELRLEHEDWLKVYNHRNSSVITDLLSLKTMEMNYMRDQVWDSKTIARTIKAVSSLCTLPKKERIKAKGRLMQAAQYSFN